MNTHADKTQQNKSRSSAIKTIQKQNGGESTFQFTNNRNEVVIQRKLQVMADNFTAQKQRKSDIFSSDNKNVIQGFFDCLWCRSDKAEKTDRERINDHLKNFTSETSAGGFKLRSKKWKSSSEILKEVVDSNPRDDQEYYLILVQALTSVEQTIADNKRNEEDKTRKAGYDKWKTDLIELLDEVQLETHLKSTIARNGSGDRMSGHGPKQVEPKQEEHPIGALPSNRFSTINKTLRNPGATSTSSKKAAYLNSSMAMWDYKGSYIFERELNYVSSSGYEPRYANTLFDGSAPSANNLPRTGTIMTDPGWAFFGEAGSKNVSSRNYTMRVKLTRAIDYENHLFGKHEAGREFATLPGSQFKLESVKEEIYYFIQVSGGHTTAAIQAIPQSLSKPSDITASTGGLEQMLMDEDDL